MKKIFSLILMSLILMLVAGIVNGADPTCTFDQALGTYPKGSAHNLSMTITNPGEGEGNNATKGVISISSGTITGALTFNTTDGTNNTYMNFTINTLALPDDTLATYTITMYNESQDAIGTACTRAYNPDNTIPVFGTITPADGSIQTTGSTVSFSVPCVNTSSATISISSRTGVLMTESSDVCTYNEDLAEGLSSYSITLTDGLNTTSASYTLRISTPGGTILDAQGVDILIQPPQAPRLTFRGFIDWFFGLFVRK